MKPLFLIILVALASPTESRAQSSVPTEFFEKGFVVHGSRQRGLKHEDMRASFRPANQPTDTQPIPTTTPTTISDAALNPNVSPPSFRSIGGVFSLEDPNGLSQYLTELIKLALQHDTSLSEVILIGDALSFYRQKDNKRLVGESLSTIQALNGKIEYARKVPQHLPITRSPTWILGTAEGRILFEGVQSISKELSSDGELLRSKSITSSQ